MNDKISVSSLVSNSKSRLMRAPLVSLSILMLGVSIGLGGLASVLPDRISTVGQTTVSDQVCIPWQGQIKANMSRIEILNAADSATSTLQIAANGVTAPLLSNERYSILLNTSEYVRVQSSGLNSGNSVGTVLSRFDSSESRGLAHADCAPLVTERWFAAVNTSSGYAQNLVLVNPDAQPVIVQISALTDAGDYPVTEFARVSVAANGTEVIDLTRVVPGKNAVSIKIAVEEGRIAAQIQARRLGVNQSLGAAVNGGISTPSNRIVLHGVTNGSDLDLLAVTALNEDAVVTATLYNEQGSQDLADFDELLIPANSVRVADISAAIGNSPSTVVITADQPIIAGVIQQVARLNFSDMEILSAQPLVSARSTAVLPMAFSGVDVLAYSNLDGPVTINVRNESELLFTETFDMRAQSFTTLKFKKPIPQGASLHFATGAEAAFTIWIERDIKNSVVSTAMQLRDLQAEVVPGARLELVQP